MSKRYRVKKINEESLLYEPFPVGKEVYTIYHPGRRWRVHSIDEHDPNLRYLLVDIADEDDSMWARPAELRI